MTRVLIIDDSAAIRCVLQEIINGEDDLEVVATATDPINALDKIRKFRPDVLTLDVEMPQMDGITFLSRLMKLHPLPVVMISSLTKERAEITLKALELGAVDVVAKPTLGIREGMTEMGHEIVAKVRAAARARLPRRSMVPPHHASGEERHSADVVLPSSLPPLISTERILVVGASTGGTEALKDLLTPLPATLPPILIAQHMPKNFTRSFAARLDSLCRMTVREARDGERLQPGHAYVAPGDYHLMVQRCGAVYNVSLSQGPAVNRHRPSVDVLFRSAANSAGKNAIGVILTGMGDDGAAGMKEMRDAGAVTFAQDEASCLVYGMPKEAVQRGGVAEVAPLNLLPRKVMAELAQRRM
ncbi:protein-glutamate methylesterase/protein-glutamine glutaminase [Geomonas agri]|uniref:protein-glutamate methylesterase/protein-glutamine glutaminase n=1 Tax=Geomonas agri TaxID=2873702 RepID=UPI001CD58D47|nr:chemotaxis response regulator protein-glutamate methylesterase [Geomonas agri]